MLVPFVPLLIVAVNPLVLSTFLSTLGPMATGVSSFPPIPFFVAIFIATGVALAPSAGISVGVMGSAGPVTMVGGNRYLVHFSRLVAIGLIDLATVGINRVLTHLSREFAVGNL
jgi:hypothetical protein